MSVLTAAQAERIIFLIDECEDVIKVCANILRFGLDSYHPYDPSRSNRVRLHDELTDLIAVYDMMIENHDIPVAGQSEIDRSKARKLGFSKHQVQK